MRCIDDYSDHNEDIFNYGMCISCGKTEKMYFVGEQVGCDICTYEWVATRQSDVKELECPHCGNMTPVN